MLNKLFVNKWVSVIYLFVFILICAIVYNIVTEINISRQMKMMDNFSINKKITDKNNYSNNDGIVKEKSNQLTANGELVNAEQSLTDTNNLFSDALTEEEKNLPYGFAKWRAENEDDEDLGESPFGFGRYPKVPVDYLDVVSWKLNYPDDTPEWVKIEHELICRVLVKLWDDGDKNFRGGSTHKGKVYPHYDDTVYVKFKYKIFDGKRQMVGMRGKSGPHVNYTEDDLLDPPPHLRVLDLDSAGIDPYNFLNLPK